MRRIERVITLDFLHSLHACLQSRTRYIGSDHTKKINHAVINKYCIIAEELDFSDTQPIFFGILILGVLFLLSCACELPKKAWEQNF